MNTDFKSRERPRVSLQIGREQTTWHLKQIRDIQQDRKIYHEIRSNSLDPLKADRAAKRWLKASTIERLRRHTQPHTTEDSQDIVRVTRPDVHAGTHLDLQTSNVSEGVKELEKAGADHVPQGGIEIKQIFGRVNVNSGASSCASSPAGATWNEPPSNVWSGALPPAAAMSTPEDRSLEGPRPSEEMDEENRNAFAQRERELALRNFLLKRQRQAVLTADVVCAEPPSNAKRLRASTNDVVDVDDQVVVSADKVGRKRRRRHGSTKHNRRRDGQH